MSERIKMNLKALVKYCQDIEKLHETYGADYDTYEANIGYQYSVSFCVEQIGEVAKKLRDCGVVEKYPEVAWNKIAGMRNRIAHGYAMVDLEMVFDISISEVPELLRQCQEFLKKETNLEEKIEAADAIQSSQTNSKQPGKTISNDKYEL